MLFSKCCKQLAYKELYWISNQFYRLKKDNAYVPIIATKQYLNYHLSEQYCKINSLRHMEQIFTYDIHF